MMPAHHKRIYLQILFQIFLVVVCLAPCRANDQEEARRLHLLMKQAEKAGKYDVALKVALDKLKLEKKIYGPNDPELVQSLGYVVLYYTEMGLYFNALPFAQQSLEIHKKHFGATSSDTAIALDNLAVLYSQIGAFDKALEIAQQANKIFKKTLGPHSIDYAVSLDNLAVLFYQVGNYSEAIATCKRAGKIFAEIRPVLYDILKNLNNLAFFYAEAGETGRAVALYQQIITRKAQVLGPKHISTLGSIGNLGYAYLSLGKYPEAESCFKKSQSQIGMVELYLATGRPAQALDLLDKQPPSVLATSSYLVRYYTLSGTALAQLGRRPDAAQHLLKAVRLIEELRHRIKGERTGFVGNIQINYQAYREMVGVLAAMAQHGEALPRDLEKFGPDPAAAAFFFAEGTKGRVLLEAIAAATRPQVQTGIPPDLKLKEQNLVNQLIALDNQWNRLFARPEATLAEAKQHLDKQKGKLTAELEALVNTLREKYPLYAALYYPQPLMARELPLKENEVLLEYALGDQTSYVFVVRKGGVKKLIAIPQGRQALEGKIKSFMAPLLNNEPLRFSSQQAGELYQLLLAEALAGVKNDEAVIIVPDGLLGLLPFEALMIQPGKTLKDSIFVGDRYTLTYYQSAAVLALQRRLQQHRATRPLLALGNPVFSAQDPRCLASKPGTKLPLQVAQAPGPSSFRALATNREWGKVTPQDKGGQELVYPPLAETEAEVQGIARLLGVEARPPDVLLNLQANETTLRRSPLKEYRCLHFATHADLAGKVQGIKEPFILLGQVGNQPGDDGFLTLSEVLGLKLQADLVVLSACHTGRGTVMAGEGVANFARAFQYAGAKSVLVSLWSVASQEAVEYMLAFYGYLKEGKPRAEALRLARRGIKAKYPHPFFWAVFILHGES
jgi:CHAT domain-containing protein